MDFIDVKEQIKKFNIQPTKSLGQNFLADRETIGRIVDAACIKSCDIVIEIGAGLGNMTCEMAPLAYTVLAVEIDRHLIPILTKNTESFSNIEILHDDIMKVDISQKISSILAGAREGCPELPLKVVANIPYYITTPVILKLIEQLPGIKSLTLTVQKEVVDRLGAEPGSRDYDILSVLVQYFFDVKSLFRIPPHLFIPTPRVSSAVVHLAGKDTQPVKLLDRRQFFMTVKAVFGQRRKTVVNALHNSGYFSEDREGIKKALDSMGADGNMRGEAFTVMQLAQLSNSLNIKHR